MSPRTLDGGASPSTGRPTASALQRVTSIVADPANPRSVSAHARARRWQRFAEAFPDITAMRVLDLGGSPSYWRSAPQRPSSVVTLNLAPFDAPEDWIEHRVGDACAPPDDLLRRSFDLVVSNSLIEHVGGHAQRQRLAEVVTAAAPRHWVQTPYRYFPVEPHWLFPGLQFLPFSSRVAITKHWRLGHMHASGDDAAVAKVHEVELLGLRQMRSYFPQSELWFERIAGLPKSMVAVRAPQ